MQDSSLNNLISYRFSSHMMRLIKEERDIDLENYFLSRSEHNPSPL